MFKNQNAKAIRIAGVTFANDADEGGRNRQEILSELTGNPFLVTLKRAIFKNEQGVEEAAIKVYNAASREMLGWIPRTEVTKLWNTDKMVAYVDVYKGTYGCTLLPQSNPTAKQYAVVSDLVRKGLIERPPVYDRDVYSRTLVAARKARAIAIAHE